MFKIFVVDRANQFHGFSFATQEEADFAYDEWEAGGHDVFLDRTKAVISMDAYNRMNKKSETNISKFF